MNAPVDSFITANRRPSQIRRHLKALRGAMHHSRLAIARIQYRVVMRLVAAGDQETAQLISGIFESACEQIDRRIIDRHNVVTDAWARSSRPAPGGSRMDS